MVLQMEQSPQVSDPVVYQASRLVSYAADSSNTEHRLSTPGVSYPSLIVAFPHKERYASFCLLQQNTTKFIENYRCKFFVMKPRREKISLTSGFFSPLSFNNLLCSVRTTQNYCLATLDQVENNLSSQMRNICNRICSNTCFTTWLNTLLLTHG